MVESKTVRLLPILGAMLTAGIIFYLSSLPNDPVPQIDIPLKAIAYHFLIFFLFAIFLIGSIKNPGKDTTIALILLSLWYAATDEFHQLFVPGRVASAKDWAIDGLGILTANILYFIRFKSPNKSKKQCATSH